MPVGAKAEHKHHHNRDSQQQSNQKQNGEQRCFREYPHRTDCRFPIHFQTITTRKSPLFRLLSHEVFFDFIG